MLLTIAGWWQSMEVLEKTFWVIALLFSFLFIVQTIMSLLGGDEGAFGDADDYVDSDDGIDQQFFTIKNLITFFTIFGWVGLACMKGGLPVWQVVICSLLAGVGAVALMLFLFTRMSKMRASGTMDIRKALHQQAETYLSIPPLREGYGKVHIRIQGSLREMRALTDDETPIPTGKPVTVIGIINESILLVTGKQ